MIGDLAVIYGGYDGVRTIDAHHTLCCAPLLLEGRAESSSGQQDAELGAVTQVRINAFGSRSDGRRSSR